MVQGTRFWATAAGTAALIALPIIGAAQSYPSSSGQSTTGQSTQTTSSSQSSSSNQNSPQFHLDKAKQVLDSIPSSSVTGEASTEIATIKRDFNDLYNDYAAAPGQGSASSSSSSSYGAAGSTSGSATTGGQVGTAGSQQSGMSGSTATGTNDWRSEYRQISQLLDRLNVPATSSRSSSGASGTPSSGSMSGTTGSTGQSGTSGTTGTTGSTSGMRSGSSSSYGGETSAATIPADIRSKLADFRMHLDEFYQIAGRSASSGYESNPAQSQSGSSMSASQYGSSSQYNQSGSQTATGTTGSSEYSASGTSGEQSPQYHLDQAKSVLDSISTGSLNSDAQAVISRLKTQFNDLYTDYQKSASAGSSSYSGTTGTSGASADWKTDFNKIENELDSLQVPKSSYAPQIGPTGSYTGTAGGGSTGATAGNMGTVSSGGTNTSTSSTSSSHTNSASTNPVGLDSATRSKLEQFRTHLEQFYSLTSGGAARNEASSGYGTSSNTSGSTGMTGTSGTSGTSSSYQSGESTQSSASGMAATTGASSNRYLDDIDNIVGQALNRQAMHPAKTGTSGTGTAGTVGTTGQSSTQQHARGKHAKNGAWISRAQLEQIKQDVQQLREQLGPGR